MPWFFSYGLSTDLEQMKADVGRWDGYQRASLPEHVYSFTGYHPDFQGGTSTLVPMRVGTILGVAYLLDDSQLESLVERGHGYVLEQNRIQVRGEAIDAFTLQPREIGPATPPSARYLERIRHGLSQHYPAQVVQLYLARALKRATGALQVPRKTATPESFKREYGSDFRRLFPWDVARKEAFGAAWAVVRPGEETSPHGHDEEETFIFLAGTGVMSVDGQQFSVQRGDAVYLEPFSAHTVRNTGDSPLEVLCVWWGAIPGAALS
jgi:mannose-6-phosphate isomerase-like protein (cupin superfamily)